MRVSRKRDGRKGITGAGDEVVFTVIRCDLREERGYIDQDPGPRRPTLCTVVVWHLLTRRDPRTPCGVGGKCGGSVPTCAAEWLDGLWRGGY